MNRPLVASAIDGLVQKEKQEEAGTRGNNQPKRKSKVAQAFLATAVKKVRKADRTKDHQESSVHAGICIATIVARN